jgi:hypothetical protein
LSNTSLLCLIALHAWKLCIYTYLILWCCVYIFNEERGSICNLSQEFSTYHVLILPVSLFSQKWRCSQSDGRYSFPIAIKLPILHWGKVVPNELSALDGFVMRIVPKS